MTPPAFDPGPYGDATYHADADRWTLVFVRHLAHSPERVWTALTEPDQLLLWAPFSTDRSLASPGDATLTMLDDATGESGEPAPASVSRADAPTLLEYTWDQDVLRWELEPDGEGTRLTLRHTLADRDWLPKVAAGWHLCLTVADRALAGEPTTPIRGEDAVRYGWEELRTGYAERLGVAA
jgi:uncharacterized protein YndB with AHSA1/START domain